MQEWLIAVIFYDRKGRTIQVQSNNHLGGAEIIRNKYAFTGELLRSKHTHNVPGKDEITQQRTYEYDHAGRLLRIRHKINNQPAVLLKELTYDELGRVVTKGIHSTDGGDNFLQTVDYYYNIRGWLTKINDINSTTDLFKEEMTYHNPLQVGGQDAEQRFDGIISSVKWKTGTNNTLKGYAYEYDGMGRDRKSVV